MNGASKNFKKIRVNLPAAGRSVLSPAERGKLCLSVIYSFKK
jgi:hypothetical protein